MKRPWLALCLAPLLGCVALAGGAREDADARVPVILPPPDAPTPLGAEPVRVASPPPPARGSSRLPVAAGQVWEGQYSCGTPMDVTVQLDAVDGTAVRATVARTDARWAAAGTFDPASGALDLQPTGWVAEAPGARMLGLYGTVSADVYEGRVTDPTCRWFTLRRAR